MKNKETLMAKHNKKRNVGLLHEQLIRHASRMTVEGSVEKAQDAVDIVTRHFKRGSETLREFRLFSSLIHTKVDSKDLAQRIVAESRRACMDHDSEKLRREKSLLIKDINHLLNEESFYDQRIPTYRIFATVQALLNEWRGASRLTPAEIVKYESRLVDHLTRQEAENELQRSENADPLVLNIMIEKFNKKYGKTLSEDQRKILELRLMNKNEEAVVLMESVKKKTLASIDRFYESLENEYLGKKRDVLVERVTNFQPDETDESVAKALSLANLLSELEAE
jgi:hypothetical protein